MIKKKRILLLDAGGPQGIAMAKYLHKKYEVWGTFHNKINYGYFSRYFNKTLIVDIKIDTLDFANWLQHLLFQNHVDALIPMSDFSASMLSKYGRGLKDLTHFIMPSAEIFEAGYDKHNLMALCKKNGYPHPETIIPESGLDGLDIEKLPYPLLIKPNHTCGGRGMTLAATAEDLVRLYPQIVEQYGDCHLQHYVPQGGAQVEVQVYINEKQELVQSSVIYKYRWYPENGGSSCCAKLVKNEKIVNICYNILKDLGWVGFADFDTIEDPTTGELLIMEINPRVPACVKTALVSGVNWAEIISGEYLKEPYEIGKYKTEKYLRHFGFEFLWFIHSKNRWKTKPNWFKLFGKDIYYEDATDWTDPLPFFIGNLGRLIQLFDPKLRKEKSSLR